MGESNTTIRLLTHEYGYCNPLMKRVCLRKKILSCLVTLESGRDLKQ